MKGYKNSRKTSSISTAGSPSSRNSGRRNRPSNHSSNGNGDTDPINTFSLTISKLPADEWKAKTVALEHLVNELSVSLALEKQEFKVQIENDNSDTEDVSFSSATFNSVDTNQSKETKETSKPHSSANNNHHHHHHGSKPVSSNHHNPKPNTSTIPISPRTTLHPTSLRNLSYPFRTLLTDLRALVVKAACSTLATLSEILKDRFSLLLKDILPTMLALHSQTVKVMHGYAQSATITMLSFTKNSKAVLGTLISEARVNKSKDVRCVCIIYLDAILTHWTKAFFMGGLSSTISRTAAKINSESAKNKENPLYAIIANQLIKSISDPSQQVRIQARQTFMDTFRRKFPNPFLSIINDRTGPLSKDPRLKRNIMKQAQQDSHKFENMEEEDGNDGEDHPASSGRASPSSRSIPSPRPIGIPRAVPSVSMTTVNSTHRQAPKYSGTTHSRDRRSGIVKPNSYISSISSPIYSSSTTPPPTSYIKSYIHTASPNNTPIHNPFSLSFTPSPKQNNDNTNGSFTYPKINANSSTDQQIALAKNRIRVKTKLRNEAVSAIQAAVRGMLTRKRIMDFLEKQMEEELELIDINPHAHNYQQPDDLESTHVVSTDDADETNSEVNSNVGLSSPEMSMLREARRVLNNHLEGGSSATPMEKVIHDDDGDDIVKTKRPTPTNNRRKSRLGNTAKAMAIRRRTAGKNEVLPLPPSPSVFTNEFHDENESNTPFQFKQIHLEMDLKDEPLAESENLLFSPENEMIHKDAEATPYHGTRTRKLIRKESLELKNRLHHHHKQQQQGSPPKPNKSNGVIAEDESLLPSSELTSIAKVLLASHQNHIEEIMEILNKEMLVVENFEKKLNLDDISDEDAVTYFESISDFLDQRNNVGKSLKGNLKKISQGET